jgi:hypothetical protein
MAIETAGKRPVKGSNLIRIENNVTFGLPKGTDEHIRKVLEFLPIEHQRGLEKLRLVDFINDPRLKNLDVPLKGDLPGLYHPKMGTTSPWLEVAMGALLQPTEGFTKRWMAKASFKMNLAGLIFSLIGQHYLLTLRHSFKKQELEPQVRQYTEKNLKAWSLKQNEGSIRAAIFKPFRPIMEKLAKWLNKKAAKMNK